MVGFSVLVVVVCLHLSYIWYVVPLSSGFVSVCMLIKILNGGVWWGIGFCLWFGCI